MVNEAAQIEREHASDGKITVNKEALAARYGISRPTIYRIIGDLTAIYDPSKLIIPHYLERNPPRTMCILSCDFIYFQALQPQPMSGKATFRKLVELAPTTKCTDCPYRDGSEIREKMSDIQLLQCPLCHKTAETMVAPNTPYPVYDLLKRIPDAQKCFAREGSRKWQAFYGHFAIRIKPIYINECLQGDHHICDLFVIIKVGKKLIRIRPILTAWMDTASGAIVDFAVSTQPNADVIAETLARAMVYTIEEPFHGIPLSIYVDCGKDFNAQLLASGEDMVADGKINRCLADNRLLDFLGVKVYRALPYHPQTKSIERFFTTLEMYISQLPGYCYKTPDKRPQGFMKKLDKLQNDGKLLSLEAFVHYLQTVILPNYHNAVQEDETKPPVELYNTLPHARDVTPNWKTMSILKSKRRSSVRIHGQGIKFKNRYYWHPKLAPFINDPIAKHLTAFRYNDHIDPVESITVIYNGRFLCEAPLANKLAFVGADPKALQEHLDEQVAGKKEQKASITRLHLRMKETGLDSKAIPRIVYVPAVDEARDAEASDLLSEFPDVKPTPTYGKQTKNYVFDNARRALFGHTPT